MFKQHNILKSSVCLEDINKNPPTRDCCAYRSAGKQRYYMAKCEKNIQFPQILIIKLKYLNLNLFIALLLIICLFTMFD